MPRPRDLLGEDRAAFAWLLTQDDLDHLPQVYRDPPVTAAAVPPDEEDPPPPAEPHLTRPHEPIEVHVGGAATVTCDGRELLVEYEAARAATTQTGDPQDMPDLADDARRPRPDWYPDDGVTLSYRELRQLLALHLARCAADPDLARAMRDGESPLHLVEVLDQ